MSTKRRHQPFPQAVRRLVMSLSVASSTTYIVYRAVYTLRVDDPYTTAASLALFIAELYGILLMCLYFWQIWDTTPVPPKPPLSGRSVDVMVPTYNEDVPLLRGTLQSMAALDYPHTVYVLDDGNRPEVAALAEELGVHYIARDNNLYAKAGNINNALDQTSGEFVAIFDADHIVLRHFLTATIGHFEDESVAFVQTPHAFYNFDSYSSTFSPGAADYWEEGDLFHHCVQNGKANANANVFCGSAAIFRRRALEDVGLISTETITEDMHTGLRLHAKGWKSVSLDERMVAAQAAPDVTAYQTQRLRWGEGNLSIIRHDNPVTMPGLTLTQRVHYAGAMLGWTTGVARLVLYLTPVMMLITEVVPIAQVSVTLVSMILCHTGVGYLALKVSGDGHFRIWRTEVVAMTSFWIHICAVWRVLSGKRGGFTVTNKRGRQATSVFRCIWPQLMIFGTGIGSLIWAGLRFFAGLNTNVLGLVTCAFLVLFHLASAWCAVRKGLRSRDTRFSYRHHSGRIHVVLKWHDTDGVEMSTQAVCVDINERGAQLHTYTDIVTSQPVEMLFQAPGYSIACSGQLVWVDSPVQKSIDSMSGTSYRIGVYFDELDRATTDALWSLSIEKVVSDKYRQLKQQNQEASTDYEQVRVSLPIRITREVAPGELTTSCGVVIGIAEDYLDFDCDFAGTVSESVHIEIATPLGSVQGRGRVTGDRTADDPHKRRIMGIRFEGQGRGLIKAVRSAAGSKSSAHLVNCVEKPPQISGPRVRRVLGTVTAAVAVILLFSFPVVYSDAWLLTGYRLGWHPASHESERVDVLLAQVKNGSTVDVAMMCNLRNALVAMDRNDDAFVVLRRLILAEPDNSGFMIAVADGLVERGDFERAFSLYLEWYAQFPTDRDPWQVLRAIRTGIAVHRRDATAELLAGLQDLESLDRDIALECIGYALQAGATEDALTFARGFENADGSLHFQEGMALMAIHSARHDWNSALATADSLYSSFPESREVLTAIAECNFWASNYAEAVRYYSAAHSTGVMNDANRARWADALLQCGNPDQALALWHTEDVAPLWYSVFLDALATPTSHFDIDLEEIIIGAVAVAAPDERLIRSIVQHLEKKDLNAALGYLDRHDETVSRVSDLRFRRARLAYLDGDYSTSLVDAQEVRRMAASDEMLRHAAHELIARSLGQLKRADESIRHFEEVAFSRFGSADLLVEAAAFALAGDQALETLRLCELADSLSSRNREVTELPGKPVNHAVQQVLGSGNFQSVPGEITEREYYLAHFVATAGDGVSTSPLDVLQLRIGALSNLGRWQDVTRHCEHFLQNSPDNPDVRQAYAESLIWSGHIHDGIEALRALQSEEPADSLQDALFARALVWGGEYQEGLAELLALPDRLQQSIPFATDVISAALGCESLTPQQQMRVRVVIDAVIAMSKDDAASRSDFATVSATDYLLRGGEYDTVIQWVSQLQGRSAVSPALRLSLAEAYRMTSQHRIAGQLYDGLVHSVPGRASGVLERGGPRSLQESAFRRRVMISAARNAHECGNSSEALPLYQTLYRRGTCSATEICEYAAVLLATGNAEKAADVFPKESEVTQQQTQLYVDILMTTGKLTLARTECQSLLEQNPHNADNLVRLANIYSAQKATRECLATWSQIKKNSSLTRSLRSQYACVLSWAKEFNYAIIEFRSVLDSGSLTADCEAAFLQAVAGSAMPLDADVTRELSRIDGEYRKRTDTDPYALESLVYAHMKTGNHAAALEHLRRLVGHDPARIDLKILLVDTLHELGDYKAASSILAPLVSDQIRNVR